jgi:adenylyltransferase/sulfurtransferase
LGSVISSSIVRAGVGRVLIVDRDYIELSNLQRQVLFDEEDIDQGLPKAVAAARKLQRVNSEVVVEPLVADLNPSNAEDIIGGADLILDGTDNFETRFLINDVCIKHGIPWVYGAVTGTTGLTMAILPHETPCLRCLLGKIPIPGTVPTCDTVGVLGPAVNIIASLEVVEGLKILMGLRTELHGKLLCVDAWAGSLDQLEIDKGDTLCPACDYGQFDFLQASEGSHVTTLCGRDAVQLTPRRGALVSFPELAERLNAVGEVSFNEYLLRFRVNSHELTVFPDGRAIIKGVADAAEARTLFSRYVGL